MSVSKSLLGLIYGLAIGLGIAVDGVDGFVAVFFLGGAGLILGLVVDGTLDLSSLGGNTSRRRL